MHCGSPQLHGQNSLLYAQADITDLLFRDVHVKRFWVGEWLSSKSDVHHIEAVETVMQYLADGTIGVKTGNGLQAPRFKI